MKTEQLRYDGDDDRYYLGDNALHCGDSLEVLVTNENTLESKWIQTRLEINGGGEWYLVGLAGYRIDGRTARK